MTRVTAMPSLFQIRKLSTGELERIVPFLQRLYPDIDAMTLMSRIDEIARKNWACLGVFEDTTLVAISGYWINTRLYCGKYLYVDHFIVDEDRRSSGLGERLLRQLREIAREEKCGQVCLDTFIGNANAQKFWFKHGFRIVGFHFVSDANF